MFSDSVLFIKKTRQKCCRNNISISYRQPVQVQGAKPSMRTLLLLVTLVAVVQCGMWSAGEPTPVREPEKEAEIMKSAEDGKKPEQRDTMKNGEDAEKPEQQEMVDKKVHKDTHKKVVKREESIVPASHAVHNPKRKRSTGMHTASPCFTVRDIMESQTKPTVKPFKKVVKRHSNHKLEEREVKKMEDQKIKKREAGSSDTIIQKMKGGCMMMYRKKRQTEGEEPVAADAAADTVPETAPATVPETAPETAPQAGSDGEINKEAAPKETVHMPMEKKTDGTMGPIPQNAMKVMHPIVPVVSFKRAKRGSVGDEERQKKGSSGKNRVRRSGGRRGGSKKG